MKNFGDKNKYNGFSGLFKKESKNMRKNVYLMATAVIAILFAVIVCATTVRAWDENEFSYNGHVEKIEDIEGTKSMLFYFNKTDTYLIYSKKNGTWLEIKDDGSDCFIDSEKEVSRNEAE